MANALYIPGLAEGLQSNALGPGLDFTGRLPPAVGSADPRMIVQPPIDPGYAMPNANIGNLNQMPGVEVSGALRAQAQQPDPYDYSARYNTPLSPAEEAQFQAWAKANGKGNDTYDYDLRGAWKSGAATSENGHLPDTYKKPNHPTFSDQSQYHGVDGVQGGTWGGGNGSPWTFTPSATNLQMMSAPALQRYFQEREPGNLLILPQAR